MPSEEVETTDVVIIGAGPTGLLLSAQLDKLRTANIVLEKDTDIWPYPRAFRNGETAWRALQNVGLEKDIYSKVAIHGDNDGKMVAGRHHDYTRPPFLRMRWHYVGFTGHYVSNPFRQPVMERCLHDHLRTTEYADLRTGCTVTSVREDENDVYVTYTDRDGHTRTIKAKFLAGADGKVGFTRKKYLEPKGVMMETTIPYEAIWCGTNFSVKDLTPERFPDFPLWKLGYTTQQIADAFIPSEFIYVSNPDRVGAVSRIGNPVEPGGLWRLEFALLEGEDRKEMQTPEKIREILMPYMTHPGSRYGLKGDVQLPWECLGIASTVTYKYAARNCNKWHVGRAMLLGDAAHVFPPYGGQGVRTGMNDATGLAWRLALACSDSKIDHDHLLRNWTLERKLDVDRALKFTMRQGDIATMTDPFRIFARDWSIWLMSWIPSVKASMERPKTNLEKYEYQDGMPFLSEKGGGMSFPQVYGKQIGGGDGEVHYTDHFIFTRQKKGIFQLVQLVSSVADLGSGDAEKYKVPEAAAPFIVDGEMATIVDDIAVVAKDLPECYGGRLPVARIASGEEFLDSALAEARPTVEGYDEHRVAKACPVRFVIVRADYMTYAQCEDWEEAVRVMEGISRIVGGT